MPTDRGEGRQGPRRRPAGRAHADRAPVRQGHRHAHGRRGRAGQGQRDPDRRAVARSRARASAACRAGASSRSSARSPRARRRSIYHVLAEAQKLGGVCAFIDAEHAMDPLYAQRDRRRHRRAARLPARLRRAGARDRRHARALRRGRRRRHRLGRRADAARRARGPDGRPDRRPAGADDEPGDAQARRQPQPHADAVPLHQPDPREGRRDVRLAGDPARRSRAEVLLVAAPGHPPHRDAQGGHRGGRQPRPRQGRQEQGRRAVPPGRVRHRVRQGHLDLGLPDRPRASSTTSSRSRARSSPTATSASARGATTPRRSSTSTPRSPRRSRPRSTRRWASTATSSSRSIPTPSRVPDDVRRQPTPTLAPASDRTGGVTDPDRLQHALDLAYRYLGHRDRTVAEVRERLSAERVEPAVVEAAVEELRAPGLPRRRPLRPALRRGPPHARRLGRRADRAPPARRGRRRRS